MATPALATQFLAAVQGVVVGLAYTPPIPVVIRGGRPGPGNESLLAGWVQGLPPICFILSSQKPEPIDDLGNFEEDTVSIKIEITYVKLGMATGAAASTTTATWGSDPDIRQKRDDLRANLYEPYLPGLGVMMDVNLTEHDVYEDLNSQRVFSTLEFTWITTETRPAI